MELKEYLRQIDEVISRGPYSADWDSLCEYKVPEWYRKAKFGIFLHWGVYSVPAFGDCWYPHSMYRQGSKEYEHHIATYGEHKSFGYKDFVPMFKAEKYNPAEWVDLFEEAGARYVVPVAEHHDGFQMYKSEISHWNAYEMGPHRDTMGELFTELGKRGIVRGASTHRFEHWFFMGPGKDFDSDVKEPLKRGDLYWPAMRDGRGSEPFTTPAPTEEFLDDWLVRSCEIVDNYRPKIMYFDWWIWHAAAREHVKKFAAYYYNRAAEWGEEVVINYKKDTFVFGSAVLDLERGMFSDIMPFFWQTDTSVSLNSWSYTESNEYRSPSSIICDLVDIVSKNGCLLLNVGPRADGTIPDEDANILREIGAWLKVNGEAIYDTCTWKYCGEGPTELIDGEFSDRVKKNYTSRDVRYTKKGEHLYAIPLHGDENGEYALTHLRKKNFYGIIKKMEMLGYDGGLSWRLDEDALHVKAAPSDSETPVVIKITLA